MRDQYVELRFPKWFIFGHLENGNADVCDVDGDICICSANDAERLIAGRAEVVNFIIEMANAFEKIDSDAFARFWYEESEWKAR